MNKFYDISHRSDVFRVIKDEKSTTLSARMGTGGHNVPIVHSYSLQGSMIGRKEKNGPQGNGVNQDVSFTLNTIDRHAATQGNLVRRLTPIECERLQGLPDDYTNVPLNGKSASDAKRYKAIGNGMAQPCADFILDQIAYYAGNQEGD